MKLLKLIVLPLLLCAFGAAYEYATDEALWQAEQLQAYLISKLFMETAYQKNIAAEPSPVDAMKGPPGVLHCATEFPDHTMDGLSSPNTDMLYCSAYGDTGEHPFILNIPASNDIYYMAQIMDWDQATIHNIGNTTTGNDAISVMIAYKEDIKTLRWSTQGCEVDEFVVVPSRRVWVLIRVWPKNRNISSITGFQQGITFEPFGRRTRGRSWGRDRLETEGLPCPLDTHFTECVVTSSAKAFFEAGDKLVSVLGTSEVDYPVLAAASTYLNFHADGSFDFDSQDIVIQNALNASMDRISMKAWWQNDIVGLNDVVVIDPAGTYGSNWFARAICAEQGLGYQTHDKAEYHVFVRQMDPRDETAPRNWPLPWNIYVLDVPTEMLDTMSSIGYWSLNAYYKKQLMPNVNKTYRVSSEDDYCIVNNTVRFYLSKNEPTTACAKKNWIPVTVPGFVYPTSMPSINIVTLIMRVYEQRGSVTLPTLKLCKAGNPVVWATYDANDWCYGDA